MLKLPIVNKVLEDIGIFFSLDELSLCAICIPASWEGKAVSSFAYDLHWSDLADSILMDMNERVSGLGNIVLLHKSRYCAPCPPFFLSTAP